MHSRALYSPRGYLAGLRERNARRIFARSEKPHEREPLEFRNAEASYSNYRRKDYSSEYFAESRLAFIDELKVRPQVGGDQRLTRQLTSPAHLPTTRQVGEAKLDLAKIALLVAAEDDALTSHSSVKFPVDAYLKRLDGLTSDFEVVLELNDMSDADDADKIDLLIEFLFGHSMPNTSHFLAYQSKFDRGDLRNTVVDAPGVYESPHPAYLNNVLTRKRGLSANLAIIVSGVLRRLIKKGVLTHWVKVRVPFHPHIHTSTHPHIHASTHPHIHTSTHPLIHSRNISSDRLCRAPGARMASPSSS